MTRAVVKDGLIYPLEPLPASWRNGQKVSVEAAEIDNLPDPSPAEIDRDFEELAAMCAAGDPADDERLKRALEEAHCLAKQQVRRQMGLP